MTEKEFEEFQLTPYANIIIEKFATAQEKLLAMDMDPDYNRMKVGGCWNDRIMFTVYRMGSNNFNIKFSESVKYQGKQKKKIRGIDADTVVSLIGEHNIMKHEIFEFPTISTIGKEERKLNIG